MTTRPTAPREPASWLYGSRGHLRAIWRVGVVVCVFFLVNGVLQSVATGPIALLSSKSGNLLSARELVDCLAAFATIAFVLLQIDRLEWSDIALSGASWNRAALLKGAGLGAAAIFLTVALLVVTGNLHFEKDALSSLLGGKPARSGSAEWAVTTLRITLLLAPAALFEELIFRGYLWRVAFDSANTRVALIVTSVLFGLAHLQNPGVNQLAIVNVMLAGAALGLVRIATDSLPAAWLAHLVWNWLMAAALHVQVSGLPLETPGYRAVLSGPDWFAGGEWGPEGGLAATLVLAAAIVFGIYKTNFNHTPSTLLIRAEGAAGARSL